MSLHVREILCKPNDSPAPAPKASGHPGQAMCWPWPPAWVLVPIFPPCGCEGRCCRPRSPQQHALACSISGVLRQTLRYSLEARKGDQSQQETREKALGYVTWRRCTGYVTWRRCMGGLLGAILMISHSWPLLFGHPTKR